MNHHLMELCKDLGLEIPQGSEFLKGDYFYKGFGDNVIKPLWNDETMPHVIGIEVNGIKLRYPFSTEDFKKTIK